MKQIIGLVLFMVLCIGCGANYFSARTRASLVSPNGVSINWDSEKDQVGLEADYDPVTGKFHIKVDKASTSEQAITSALQATMKIQEVFATLMAQLIPIIQQATAITTKGVTTVPSVAAPSIKPNP